MLRQPLQPTIADITPENSTPPTGHPSSSTSPNTTQNYSSSQLSLKDYQGYFFFRMDTGTIGKYQASRWTDKGSNADTLMANESTFILSQIPEDKKKIHADEISTFGWLYDPRVSGKKLYVFSIGDVTDKNNLPTSGNAVYEGMAYWVPDTFGVVEAKANFNVNFAEKTVNGKISTAKEELVLPTSMIKGNEFYSNNNPWVDGYFYGKNAEKLGGTFSTGKDGFGSGAFEATKQ